MRRPLGSTYRLQLHGIGFEGARRLVPYLDDLGIEVLYLSPVLTAVPGSTHGYDVADPSVVDPALGGREGLEGLLVDLDRHHMRLLLDVVPNHLAAHPADPWWWDVLRLGPASPFAAVFDIDWAAQDGRVLLPVLGSSLGEALAADELRVDGNVVVYHDHRFPIDPATLRRWRRRPDQDLGWLLDRQHYRLGHWRLANREGNYRRFFDVDGLVGVRVEDPEVYAATHATILEMLADPRIAGIRLDHVDGLADPGGYLARLRSDVSVVRPDPPVVLAEKIVARGERVPSAWPLDGLTGYEFADLAAGLLVAPQEGPPAETGGSPGTGFATLAHRTKLAVLDDLFAGQVDRLIGAVGDALAADKARADLSGTDIRDAIRALTAALPVYRTYLGAGPPSTADRRTVSAAAARAADELGAEGRRALARLVAGLLSDPGPDRPGPGWTEVARRWQQLSGAVAAKGVEDTALYRLDGPLASAEVGTDPDRAVTTPDEFHRAMVDRARRWPGALNATSTHDTKRSEDVRARLSVLTELPDRWAHLVRHWSEDHHALVDDLGGPVSSHDQAMTFQAAVALWPAAGVLGSSHRRRIADYLVKAAREAKLRTSWLEPDPGYERRIRRFADRLLAPDSSFGGEAARLVAEIGPAAAANALALVVLRSTTPGVPDLYQGNECWNLQLVDPDNRTPVDFAGRRRLLARLDRSAPDGSPPPVADLLDHWEDARIKLWVTAALLRLRRDRPATFGRGRYLPLDVHGPAADHVVAFARTTRSDTVVTVVPRLTYGLAGPGCFAVGPVWGRTTIDLGPRRERWWRDVLSGQTLSLRRGHLTLADALAALPVAVLVPASPAAFRRPVTG